MKKTNLIVLNHIYIESNPQVLDNIKNINQSIIVASIDSQQQINLNNVSIISRYPDLNKEVIEKSIEATNLFYNNKTILIEIIERYFYGKNLIRKSKLFIENFYYDIINYSFNLLKKEKSNLVYFGDTPHNPFDYSVFVLSNKLNIKTVVSKKLPNPFLGEYYTTRIFFSRNFPRVDNYFSEELKYSKQSSANSYNDLELDKDSLKVIERYKGLSNISSDYPGFVATKWSVLTLSSYFRSKLKKIKSLEDLITYSFKILPFLRTYSIGSIEKVIYGEYLRRIKNDQVENLKYLFFPLHFQPEGTTLPLGHKFIDQFSLIESISSILPDELYILIKEHQAYWMRRSANENISYSRSLSLYKKISKLKNVIFIDTFTDSDLIMDKSMGVITINGTVVFEALAKNKPALVFGDFIYRDFPNAFHPKTDSELLNWCNLLLEGTLEYNDLDFISTLKAIQSSSLLINTEKSINHNDIALMHINYLIEHYLNEN